MAWARSVVNLICCVETRTARMALTWRADRIDARERSLTCQIEQTQAEIGTLTARPNDLSQAIEHLRISRKTLISLAEEDLPRSSLSRRRHLSPTTPPTSRFSPSSARSAAPCAPVAWPWPWTCP
jgi:hypothetical protein